jgi:hypothetical protein
LNLVAGRVGPTRRALSVVRGTMGARPGRPFLCGVIPDFTESDSRATQPPLASIGSPADLSLFCCASTGSTTVRLVCLDSIPSRGFGLAEKEIRGPPPRVIVFNFKIVWDKLLFGGVTHHIKATVSKSEIQRGRYLTTKNAIDIYI